MTEYSKEFRASRLVWRFNKSGGSGEYSGPVAELPEDVRARLLKDAEVSSCEVPAIATVPSSDTWMLVTTDRILWSIDGTKSAMNCNELEDVRLETELVNQVGEKAKHQMRKLRLLRKDGQLLELAVEPGPPYFGFVNVLMTISARNASGAGGPSE